MSQRAHRAALPSRWSAVAQAYLTRARENIDAAATKAPLLTAGNAPSFQAVERMSDDCGIFQHGKYRLADRRHGYCADDNARALSLMARKSMLGELPPDQLALTYNYAAFMNHAWNEDNGRFRNFMSYARAWLDEGGSDDCCARSFESLVDVVRSDLPQDLREWATELGQRVAPAAATWTSLRAKAIMIKALINSHGQIGHADQSNAMIRQFAHDINHSFKHHSRQDHVWFEPKLSYDNARVAESLILAGNFLGDETILRCGVSALAWLMEKQTCPGKTCFLPIPTSGFAEGGQSHPLFDQQPLEVQATLEACLTAWRITADPVWQEEAQRAFAWFEGGNNHGLSLVTPDGGCCDGLTPEGCNANQGAESILAWHLSRVALESAR